MKPKSKRKRNPLDDPRVKRINAAFVKLGQAVDAYLATCAVNGAPVRTVTIRGTARGTHDRTTVRCYRTPRTPR